MANYRVVVQYDPERKVHVARAPELEHCTADGATRAEALQKLEEEMRAQLDNISEQGGVAPAALDDDLAAHDGSLSVKVSSGLQRDLAWQARVEGIGLAQLVGEMLAASLDARRRERRRGGPNLQSQGPVAAGDEAGGNSAMRRDQGGGGGARRGFAGGRDRDGRYHAIMEDKATFLEYVRQLESGGPPARGGGAGGGGSYGGGGRGPRRDRGRPGGGGGRGPGGQGGPGGGGQGGGGSDENL